MSFCPCSTDPCFCRKADHVVSFALKGVKEGQVNFCKASRDGDCVWEHCPQLRDNEPNATGRHCPLDEGCGYCLLPEDECEC